MSLVARHGVEEGRSTILGDKFLRIVDDGTGPVALFEKDGGAADERVFALRRDLLSARLAERQRQMLDTSEEERALLELDQALEEARRTR